jgi:hypothetical protein
VELILEWLSVLPLKVINPNLSHTRLDFNSPDTLSDREGYNKELFYKTSSVCTSYRHPLPMERATMRKAIMW